MARVSTVAQVGMHIAHLFWSPRRRAHSDDALSDMDTQCVPTSRRLAL